MYGAWSTGKTVASKEEVPLWQIAVVALTICFGFITYGYVSYTHSNLILF
jgi:sodium-dependent phosphate transporter